MPLSRLTQFSWIHDLYNLAQHPVENAGWHGVYQRILEHVVQGVEAQSGSLALCDTEMKTLTIVAGIDLPSGVIGSSQEAGSNIMGKVLSEAKPVLLNGDVSGDARFSRAERVGANRTPGSAMCWPLIIEKRVVGVLSANRPSDQPPFEKADLDQGALVLNLVGLVLENLRINNATDQEMSALADANVRMLFYNDTMKQIREADSSLGKSGALIEFCRSVVLHTMELFDAHYGAFGLFGTDGKLISFIYEGVDLDTHVKFSGEQQDQGLLQIFYQEEKIVRVDDVAADPRSSGLPHHSSPIKSLMAAPMGHQRAAHGVLYLADKNGGGPFTESDEILVGMLAGDCGDIMERHHLLAIQHEISLALKREHEEQRALISKLEQAQNQLLQSDKMASIGQLAAGVAHEINNPIGFVYSNLGTLEKYLVDLFAVLDSYEQAQGDAVKLSAVEALKKKVDLVYLKEDVPTLMHESRDGITRVKKIVQDLKDFSHVDSSDEWQWADMHKGLNSTLNIAANEIKYKAEVIKEYGQLPEIQCLPSQLNQVFMNLLVNAAHAIEERGTITLRTGVDGDQIWVSVSDTGKGIPAENLKRIFDPFFTTKAVGKGTGLGLSLSYGIVQKHHGSITVSSELGKGSTFKVCFPISQPGDAAGVAENAGSQ